MLFDLRGAGRRRTVKIVYITLAFLMGGGLVLFGIGGGGGISGGLVDAITERSGGGDTGARPLPQAGGGGARAHARPTRRTPPPGPRSPARASSSPAPARTSTPTRAPSPRPARAKLDSRRRRVGALPRARPQEARRPRREPDGAGLRRAQPARQGGRRRRRSSPTPARRPPTFTQLAIFAYQAGQTRKGDLAKNKALELTDPDMREALKGQLEHGEAVGGRPPPRRSPAPTP